MHLAPPDGYLAVPASGDGPGVLVLHAWWGLNDILKRFCDRLAAAGFVAFAPDLYHGQVADTIPGAQALAGALEANPQQVGADVAAAANYLAERVGGDLAVIGISLGAFYALYLAAADPDRIRAAVIFYGTGVEEHGNSRAAYLGHFAGDDEFEPQEAVDSLEQSLLRAGRAATIYRYPGTKHWFFEADRPEYDQASAELAWERTLAFLRA